MAATIVISYEPNPDPEFIQILSDGICDYAKLKKGFSPFEHFSFLGRDENNKIVAGCNGVIYYGCLYIDQLWIDEPLRKRGIGTQLMISAEDLGKQKGCLFSTVNTMDWEALGFYQRLGYKIEYQRTGYFKNSSLYMLRKDFN